MRTDYDELLSKTHTFKIRGETFTWDDVPPEVLETWEPKRNGKKELSVWENIDQQIMLFIVPEDHERWKKLRARTSAPATIKQVTQLLKDLVEETTGRPTIEPSA